MSFKTGDIVTHALGGPKMQVKTVHSEKLVSCFWFDGHGAPHEEGFKTADLAIAPAPDFLHREHAVEVPVIPSSGARGKARGLHNLVSDKEPDMTGTPPAAGAYECDETKPKGKAKARG